LEPLAKGRVLLELKSRYPRINVIGTNLKSYGFVQADGSSGIWIIASHFNATVYCTPDQNESSK
jgi:hypothetical protein